MCGKASFGLKTPQKTCNTEQFGLSYSVNELLENITLREDFQTLKKPNTQKKILCRIHLPYLRQACA